MKWLLVLVIYAAPADAVDWNGPWSFGMTHLVETPFDSEEACRGAARQVIERLHEGMKAPIRYRCVAVEDGLPKDAPR
jgi:hypothetical protein